MRIIITPWKAPLTHLFDGKQLISYPAVLSMGRSLGVRDYARSGPSIYVASTYQNAIVELRSGDLTPVGPPTDAQDQYHVNGVALADGKPRYATMCGLDWRADRTDGAVYDCDENRPICTGLTMPHSPRLHGDDLWVCNSGKREVGKVINGQFSPVATFEGFPRGLCFQGDQMFVGVSRLRGGDLPCGIATFDLRTETQTNWQAFDAFREIFVLEAVE